MIWCNDPILFLLSLIKNILCFKQYWIFCKDSLSVLYILEPWWSPDQLICLASLPNDNRQNIRGLCGCSLKATQKQLQWTKWFLVLHSYNHMISPNYSTAAYTGVGFTHHLQKNEPLSCDITQSGRIALAQVTYWKYSWTCTLLSLA